MKFFCLKINCDFPERLAPQIKKFKEMRLTFLEACLTMEKAVIQNLIDKANSEVRVMNFKQFTNKYPKTFEKLKCLLKFDGGHTLN